MGGLAIWIRRGLVAALIVAMAVYYLYHFRGLATSQAMDQAQIGRAIAAGKGWTTNFARPLAIAQLRANQKDPKTNIWFDTYNAPASAARLCHSTPGRQSVVENVAHGSALYRR